MCAVPAINWSCSMPRDAPSISMVNVAVVCGVECHVFEAHGVRATVAVLPDSRSSHCITAAITGVLAGNVVGWIANATSGVGFSTDPSESTPRKLVRHRKSPRRGQRVRCIFNIGDFAPRPVP